MTRGCAVLLLAAACVLALAPPGSPVQAAESDDEKRCSVSVRAYGAPPPTHDGGERRNPDGSVYPGDAIHYIFVYGGLDTCISFSVGGLKSFGSMHVREHEVADAVSVGGPEPGGDLPPPPPPPLRPKTHSHSAHDLSVVWDDDANEAVWGEAGAPHGMHGGVEYEDEESRLVFAKRVADLCTSEQKHAGCAWGHVEILMDAADQICLYEEARKQGAGLPEGVPDECRDRNYLTMGVEGTGRSCSDTADGRVCTTYTRTDTAVVRVNVLDPLLGLELSKPPLRDVYGFDAQNLDGTYYLQDPVHVVHEPVFKWREARGGTIDFVTTRHWYDDGGLERVLLPIVGAMDCGADECYLPFAVAGTTPTAQQLANGDGQTAYSAASGEWLGSHLLSYKVDVYNIEQTAERLLNSTENGTTAKAVVFDPVFNFTTYPVLADDGKYGHENRFALASWYGGSWGGGPDDANMTEPYEYRRARMDAAYGAVAGYDPVDLTTLSWNLVWSEAPKTPPHVLGYGAQGHPEIAFHSTSELPRLYPDVAPLSDREAAMWPKTGHGRIFFDFPDIAKYRLGEPGSRYHNATAYVYTMASDFAAEPHRFMASGLYTYPDTLFHQRVTIRSVDSEGDVKPIGMSLASKPRLDLGAIPLADYIREKVLHDTADPGFADLAVHDTYPMALDMRTESGYIDAKVRRTASLFVKYGHDAHLGEEAPGGPGPLLPFMLALPGTGEPSFLFGQSTSPGITGPNPADAGLEGLFGFVSQVERLGNALSGVLPDGLGRAVPEGFWFDGNTALPRPDIEALKLYQNMSRELGYGGLAGMAEGAYVAFPDTSRINFPLSYGLAVLSPLNVTLGTDSYVQSIDHRFGLTEGGLNITINTDKDNVLLAERNNGILSISYDENFGAMLNVAVAGSNHGSPAGSVGACAWGCDMYVGRGSLDVTAYNKWGGEAHYDEGELERPPPPTVAIHETTYDEWFWVLALAILGMLAYRLANNRLANGVWSVRA